LEALRKINAERGLSFTTSRLRRKRGAGAINIVDVHAVRICANQQNDKTVGTTGCARVEVRVAVGNPVPVDAPGSPGVGHRGKA